MRRLFAVFACLVSFSTEAQTNLSPPLQQPSLEAMLRSDEALGKTLHEGAPDAAKKLDAWGQTVLTDPALWRSRLEAMARGLDWENFGNGALVLPWRNLLTSVEESRSDLHRFEVWPILEPMFQWSFRQPDPQWECELMDQRFGKRGFARHQLYALASTPEGRAASLRLTGRWEGLQGSLDSIHGGRLSFPAMSKEEALAAMKRLGWAGRMKVSEWLDRTNRKDENFRFTLLERVTNWDIGLFHENREKGLKLAKAILEDSSISRAEAHLLAAVLTHPREGQRNHQSTALFAEAVRLEPEPFRVMAEQDPATASRFFGEWFGTFEPLPDRDATVNDLLSLVQKRRKEGFLAQLKPYADRKFEMPYQHEFVQTLKEMMRLDLASVVDPILAHTNYLAQNPSLSNGLSQNSRGDVKGHVFASLLEQLKPDLRTWSRLQIAAGKHPRGPKHSLAFTFMQWPLVGSKSSANGVPTLYVQVAEIMLREGVGLSDQEKAALAASLSWNISLVGNASPSPKELEMALDLLRDDPIFRLHLETFGLSILFQEGKVSDQKEKLERLWLKWLGLKQILPPAPPRGLLFHLAIDGARAGHHEPLSLPRN